MIGDIILCRAIAAENEEMIKAAERFTKLCSNERTELTSHTALAKLSKWKFNKPSTVPFTRDVRLFHQHLEKKSAWSCWKPDKARISKDVCGTCQSDTCPNNYLQQTLCRWSLGKWASQRLSKSWSSTSAEWKLGHGAPPVASSEDRIASGFLQVSVLQRILNISGLHASAKHVATLSQILNLKNHELNQLADFLGHDIRVHRDFYGLPEATIETAKISKVLLATENGSLARFRGNSLDEIEIGGICKCIIKVVILNKSNCLIIL